MRDLGDLGTVVARRFDQRLQRRNHVVRRDQLVVGELDRLGQRQTDRLLDRQRGQRDPVVGHPRVAVNLPRPVLEAHEIRERHLAGVGGVHLFGLLDRAGQDLLSVLEVRLHRQRVEAQRVEATDLGPNRVGDLARVLLLDRDPLSRRGDPGRVAPEGRQRLHDAPLDVRVRSPIGEIVMIRRTETDAPSALYIGAR